ncbi:hypothetical protein SAMN05216436_1356 [bacterium A37T11]|nr:hypothetical protein SAMN05216436_1356 [bacterium A37T11]
MKGTKIFTQCEANEMIDQIKQKLYADENDQKKIRNKICKLGFYSTDFGMGSGNSYTVDYFLSVVSIKSKGG